MLVADAWQGAGIGRRLLHDLECRARAAGFERIEGEVLAHNSSMLGLAHAKGYDVRRHPESALFLRVTRPLHDAAPDCSPIAKFAKGANTNAVAHV